MVEIENLEIKVIVKIKRRQERNVTQERRPCRDERRNWS